MKIVNSVKLQCKIIRRTFFISLHTQPFVATLMLGNVFGALEQNISSEQRLIYLKTIDKLKRNFSQQHIHLLWEQIVRSAEKTFEESTHLSLQALKKILLSEGDFLQHMNAAQLLQYPIKLSDYRWFLIGLLRKHVDQQAVNPFVGFSYKLLEQGSYEQNYSYIARFIRQMSSLPIENIIELGKQNKVIADAVLNDLADHPDYFVISSQYAYIHSSLAKPIAAQWKAYLETFPLTHTLKQKILNELKHLQAKYQEFKQVVFDERAKKYFSQLKKSNFALFDIIYLASAVPLLTYLSPRIYTHGSNVLTLASATFNGTVSASLAVAVVSSAMPLLTPLIFYLGIGWLAEHWLKAPAKKLRF